MTWTGDMTKTALKALRWAILGTVASLTTASLALGAMTTTNVQGTSELLDRGGIGFAALLVLVVVAPTVTAGVWLVRRIVAMFGEQLKAQQAEREKLAAASAKAIVDLAEAHRLERQEYATREQVERKEAWGAVIAAGKAATEMSIKHTAAIDKLCANLDRRPCIANGSIRPTEESP